MIAHLYQSERISQYMGDLQMRCRSHRAQQLFEALQLEHSSRGRRVSHLRAISVLRELHVRSRDCGAPRPTDTPNVYQEGSSLS